MIGSPEHSGVSSIYSEMITFSPSNVMVIIRKPLMTIAGLSWGRPSVGWAGSRFKPRLQPLYIGYASSSLFSFSALCDEN